jgi:hypothetical protein
MAENRRRLPRFSQQIVDDDEEEGIPDMGILKTLNSLSETAKKNYLQWYQKVTEKPKKSDDLSTNARQEQSHNDSELQSFCIENDDDDDDDDDDAMNVIDLNEGPKNSPSGMKKRIVTKRNDL